MSIGQIFDDVQRSNVSHKSLVKRLKRLEGIPEFDEDIKQCIFRLLEVAKAEAAGNRLVKFLTLYMQDADASSPTTSAILLALLPYLSAKDKTARYRATQIVSQILGVLSAIDDELYGAIRNELIRRLHDKVPAIRLEAVTALGRLVESEMDDNPDEKDSDSDSDYEAGLLEKLLDVLQNDSNADVRRALLLNLPITPTTLPYLLERARDRDAPTRRALYSRLLPKLGDFRHLSLSMREKLLRWGLRDRDEKVRQATARLFSERWIEDCANTKDHANETQLDGEQQPEQPEKPIAEASIPALLELLERIDIMNSGAENGIGLDAMREFWASRPDYVDAVNFEDDFWENLTAESAFMARTFIECCQQDPATQAKLEEKMPEVTRIGFYLQKNLNNLLDTIRAINDGTRPDDDQVDQEFIVEQLLHVAHHLDYTDEIGRRKMFSLLRDAISVAELPEESTRLAVEALRLVCNADAAGEREFTAVILEAIAEVHDTITPSEPEVPENEEDSFVSARSEVYSEPASDTTPTRANPAAANGPKQRKASSGKPKPTTEEEEAKALKEIVINLKCLHIAQSMLQNVTGNLQSNIHLESLLNNLVIPAVRSYEIPVRERGVLCLGLCCMLEPKLAEENAPLFVHCLARGNEGLQVMCVKILCDVLLSRGRGSGSEEVALDLAPFVKGLRSEYGEVQSTAAGSLGKLMLCGFYIGNEAVFDEACEVAIGENAKGAELLGKVRAAVQVEAAQEAAAVASEQGDVGGAVVAPEKRQKSSSKRVSAESRGE
jgi:condensin complex subunit 3